MDPISFSLERSVHRYVSECTDCETGKGRPVINGESPGNLQATYPFQIIAMDHIPSLPRSFKGNTELLIWVDLFSGCRCVSLGIGLLLMKNWCCKGDAARTGLVQEKRR